MRASITQDLVRKLPAGPVDIWDIKLPRFVVRVRATGTASYLVSLGRGAWHTIAPVGHLEPHEAREQARQLLGDVAKDKTNGRDPIAERKRRRQASRAVPTFEGFLDKHFEPWATEHQKRGAETTQRLRAVFAEFLPLRLDAITAWTVEQWRTKRLKAKTGKRPRPATVNSHLVMLKAALSKAVLWKLLPSMPLEDVKPLKADRTGRIRYLSPNEEQRLRAALDKRDQRRQARRAAANEWRRARGYPEWPAENPDHLRPIVLLAMNTGLRKGEIFNLAWRDVDFGGAQLTVRGEGAKSGQTRYVPLNSEALTVLRDWRKATTNHGGYVFVGRGENADDERLDDVKKAWLPIVRAAKLEQFRFHDLRHTFASKLVMAGVDLNTVRELLGHADLKMTLRYAHLAPEHKAAAVAKLVSA